MCFGGLSEVAIRNYVVLWSLFIQHIFPVGLAAAKTNYIQNINVSQLAYAHNPAKNHHLHAHRYVFCQ
jgi:hypothetical protein